MGDRIGITGLRVHAYHGVFDEERRDGQVFLVDLALDVDHAVAAESDDVADTVDYGALAAAVHERVAGEQWNLIERVAQRVADLVLEDARVLAVRVTVHKPTAPVVVDVDDVFVSIERSRDG